jgi:hypothetical protein
MAAVMPLPSNNSLGRPFTDLAYMRSCSSFASHASAGTVRRTFPRSASAASVRSIPSLRSENWLGTNENTLPRLASRSLLDLIHDMDGRPCPRRAWSHTAQKGSWCTWDTNCPALGYGHLCPSPEDIQVDPHLTCLTQILVPASDRFDEGQEKATEQGRLKAPLLAKSAETAQLLDADNDEDGESQYSSEPPSGGLPFRRWLSTLRKRNLQKSKTLPVQLECGLEMSDLMLTSNAHAKNESAHRKSHSMTSSLGLITAVKSASMTLASASIAPHSRRGERSSHRRSDHGSSGLSDLRISFDSKGSVDPGMDARAENRATERRKIVEEILESEESYIADMKALVNVCCGLP